MPPSHPTGLKVSACKNWATKPILLCKGDMARGSQHMTHAELRPKQKEKSLFWYCQTKWQNNKWIVQATLQVQTRKDSTAVVGNRAQTLL